jgi:hypothetical protein
MAFSNFPDTCATSFFTLMMEAAKSSETVVTYHIPKWRNQPEDHDLILHCVENLKCRYKGKIIPESSQ